MAIKVSGVGAYCPEKVLTNFDLEKIVNTSDKWIRSRTGIVERRIAAPDEQVSDMACAAALKAMAPSGTTPDEIDAIILSSTSVEYTFPSTACALQHKLGNTRAFCFDVQAACSGLVYSLETMRCYLKANPEIKKALVVGAEKMSTVVDWTDRDTCVLFGDGAAAILLENDGTDGPDCFVASYLGSNGAYLDRLLIPAGGSRLPATAQTVEQHLHFLKMDGPVIFKLAVSYMLESAERVMAKAGMAADQIDWVVPHQANLRIINAVGERLGIPDERIFKNVQSYGNTCAATVGIALDEMQQKGLLKNGQNILLTAVGGGLTWGAIILKWNC